MAMTPEQFITRRRERQKKYYQEHKEAVKERNRNAYEQNRKLGYCTKCGHDDAGFASRCCACADRESRSHVVCPPNIAQPTGHAAMVEQNI